MDSFNRRLTLLLVGVFALVLGAVFFGEFLRWFDFLNELSPSRWVWCWCWPTAIPF